MDYLEIKNFSQLMGYLQRLKEEKRWCIALDLEAEYNLHEYGEKLCLIQIFDGDNFVIIDPYAFSRKQLGKLFQNRDILKVMFDATSDLSLMKNSYSLDILSILDLSPALELLNYSKRNLHALIEHDMGVTLTKKSRFQRYNWTRRPIHKEAIEYALNDVRYLLDLKDKLLEKLTDKKLIDAFMLKNLQIQNKDYFKPKGERYKNVKGFKFLTPAQGLVFKDLYEIRDRIAQRLNKPPFQVVNNQDLMGLAKGAITTREMDLSPRLRKEVKLELVMGFIEVLGESVTL